MGALATTTNDNLLSLVRSVPHNSIVIIEDIDHLFENNASDKEKKDTLTMSGLLNVLDGMQSQEGSSKLLSDFAMNITSNACISDLYDL